MQSRWPRQGRNEGLVCDIAMFICMNELYDHVPSSLPSAVAGHLWRHAHGAVHDPRHQGIHPVGHPLRDLHLLVRSIDPPCYSRSMGHDRARRSLPRRIPSPNPVTYFGDASTIAGGEARYDERKAFDPPLPDFS